MTSHNERFRSRGGLIPPNFKFPGFQGLCLSGVDSSYLSSAMGSPAVMVLTSTGGDVVSPHVPGQVSFARQRMDKDGNSNHVPFPSPSFPVRPLFGQGDPYGPLSSPLLSLHHPLLASHTLSRSYLNAAAAGGAFRPLGIPEDRNGFHGSAFMPAKCMKMEQSPTDLTSPQHLLIPPCFQSGDSGSFQSPANSHASTGSLHGGSGLGSFLDVKDEDHRDSDSLADGADRLTETPISDGSRSIDRTTPDDRGTPKRHKKFFLEGQTPYCPICGTSLQLSELSSHFEMEVERLMEMSKCISQQMDTSPLRSPFSSPLTRKDGHEKGKPESRWETYQRVKINRQNRLSSRACTGKRKKWEESPSPPGRTDRVQEEASHMMVPGIRKRDGQDMETDSAADSHSAAEQFSWAVSARLHAIAQLQRGLAESYTRKFEAADEENQELNVDGDDSATYGQPHYTEADVITCSTEDNPENKDALSSIAVTESSTYQRLSESSQWNSNGAGTNGEGQEVTSTCVNNIDASGEFSPSEKGQKVAKENGEVTKDHEHSEDGIKCLICMEPFIKPVVSICCWHVHCEECWLKTLGTKKLCPQCNMITSVRDLRRIYL